MVPKRVSNKTPYLFGWRRVLPNCAASHTHTIIAVLLIASIVTLSSVAEHIQAAAAGDLDPGFDNDGKVSTDFFGDADAALDMVIQADGRIVAGGYARNAGSNVDFALARYNSDGSLDNTFGSGGKVTTDFSNIFDQVNALALQVDGRIVAAGITRDQTDRAAFALARYRSDGSLDPTFGSGGKVVTDFTGGGGAARGVAIQPDGRIVAAGASLAGMSGDFALVRYHDDGSLDQGFGVGGRVTTDFFGFSDGATAVSLLPDGRIIAAGSSPTSIANTNFALARYSANGSLDASFGGDGKVTTDFFGFTDNVSGLVLQPDGRVVAAGGANNLRGTGFDFALARYEVDGSLDMSFGDGGKTTTDFLGIVDAAVDVTLHPDGRVVAVGFASNDPAGLQADIALARYEANGRLDTSFGNGGRVITAFSGDRDGANAVGIQGDGLIVVAGSAFSGGILGDNTKGDFALARYAAVTGPDFALAVAPEPVTVSLGQKIKVRVSVSRSEGFAGDVTITAPDAERLTIVMTPESATTSGDLIKFRLKIKGSTPTGTHQIAFIGRDPLGRERRATLTLQIQ